MEKAKYFLWGLVGLTSIWSFVKMFGGHGEIGGIVNEKQLISEVTFAVSGIECGYPDAGYVYYTPTEAAENYISLINSIGSEADDLAKAAGRLPQKPLKHIIGLPDAPWEIVLQPDEEEKKIVVLGFGENLITPIIEQVVSCS